MQVGEEEAVCDDVRTGMARTVAAALTLEHFIYSPVWVCEGRCVAFLCNLVSFDDFVVDAIEHAIAQVSLRRIVSLLD